MPALYKTTRCQPKEMIKRFDQTSNPPTNNAPHHRMPMNNASCGSPRYDTNEWRSCVNMRQYCWIMPWLATCKVASPSNYTCVTVDPDFSVSWLACRWHRQQPALSSMFHSWKILYVDLLRSPTNEWRSCVNMRQHCWIMPCWLASGCKQSPALPMGCIK